MIERYTIKFGPAVSQKELEKMLHESGDMPDPAVTPYLHKMKTRIEVICEFADVRKIDEVLKELSKK
jgi:hypothetical protein